VVCGQESPGVPQRQPAPTVALPEETKKNANAPCVEPPPLVRLEDYDGPLKKTVGIFARKLERKSIHPPHYKPGAMLCSLELKDKFVLFVMDSIDPASFLDSAFNAGLAQAQDDDLTFGQGAAGYGKRFSASFADQASSKFFTDFVFPTIFSEDPRYYRLASGSGGSRFLHAVEHVFVAHRDDGNRMFNSSEWLGTTSAVVLSNTYHPGNERGVAAALQMVGFSVIQDMGFDVLREFWPEISRKFRLPFRGESEPTNPASPERVKEGDGHSE
jgi:hypothetical protein